MAKRKPLQLGCLLLTLVVGGVNADDARAKRSALKRQQRELARLLKDYRGVKTVELKQGFVDEAIKRGRPFTDGLKRQIEAEGQAKLRAYRDVFLTTVDDAPKIEPASIVEANSKLGEQRADLVQLCKWIDALKSQIDATRHLPAADDDESVNDSADELREREEAYVKQWLSAKGVGRITRVEAGLVQQVNRFRAEEGLPALEIDYKLCGAARDHSLDMTNELFFSHKSELRHKLTYEIRAVRFGTTAHSEIIANCPNPNMVVPLWKASSGHKRAMIDPTVQRVGVGHFGRKYTMMFGAGRVEKREKEATEEEE